VSYSSIRANAWTLATWPFSQPKDGRPCVYGDVLGSASSRPEMNFGNRVHPWTMPRSTTPHPVRPCGHHRRRFCWRGGLFRRSDEGSRGAVRDPQESAGFSPRLHELDQLSVRGSISRWSMGAIRLPGSSRTRLLRLNKPRSHRCTPVCAFWRPEAFQMSTRPCRVPAGGSTGGVSFWTKASAGATGRGFPNA
jgi:hypothetical protein